MKKKYIHPTIEIMVAESGELLSGSVDRIMDEYNDEDVQLTRDMHFDLWGDNEE